MVESSNAIKVRSYAKINLFLEITGKRNDGFHEIETIMHEIDLADEMIFSPRCDNQINLTCTDNTIPCDSKNLIIKATKKLQEKFPNAKKIGVDIHLIKKIPAGGGLGGGSSNCAVTLDALNKLWGLNASGEQLEEIASSLGSDINFFLNGYGGTCLCKGRGEKITKLNNISLSNIILVFPEWGISTKSAYDNLDKNRFNKKNIKEFIDAINNNSQKTIVEAIYNHFEHSVFINEPKEKAVFDNLKKLPFKKVAMSGSGSTLFGVLNDDEDINTVLKKVKLIDGVHECIAVKSKL